jgi:hypothetical protein
MPVFGAKVSIVILIASVFAVSIITTPVSIYAQQKQMNFAATLTGKDMIPPVNTNATGTAKFHINPDGSLCYQVTVSNINGVLGSHIGSKNGTEYADLLNPYAVIATQQAYPTGPVNGVLTSGDIKSGVTSALQAPFGSNALHGPLIGKPVTALDNIIKNKTAYVTVRTLGHESGSIQGQILPTSENVDCTTLSRFATPSTTPSPSNTAGLPSLP